jgi:L,D-transpeptidase YcbB
MNADDPVLSSLASPDTIDMLTLRAERKGSPKVYRGFVSVLVAALVFVDPVLHAQSMNSRNTSIAASVSAASTSLSPSALAHGALQALQAVYSRSGNALLWSHAGHTTPQADALLLLLQDPEGYGLDAKDYVGSDTESQKRLLPPSSPANELLSEQFDTRLSAALLHLITDLHFGRVSPEAAGFKLREERAPFDLATALEQLAVAPDVNRALTAVEPPFYHYALLKEALARYRKTKLLPLAQLPPAPKALKVGDSYAGVPALRSFLGTIGDLAAAAAAPQTDLTFDASLSDAVRSFQLRHGLSVNGKLDEATLASMRTPPAQRIRQIILTLERWRWLTPFKTPPIIVNIPQFRLFAFRTTEDRAADILQMDVIVGRTYPQTQTPVFEGDMRYVILRPYWDVPYNITKHEMLAKIRANPGYLAAQHLEIASGPDDSSPAVPATPENLDALAAGKLRLRQLPGEDNALGLAKFIFPNDYNVYLHSTPAHALFRESVRAFSHSCIRVSDPLALATLVLKDAPGEWTREKIDAAMHGTGSVRVNLKQPINVLILYGTALATEAGPVFFFDDVYGYDKKLERQLGLAPVQ